MNGQSLSLLAKSVAHNLGVVIVGFAFCLIGVGLDRFLRFPRFACLLALSVGCLLLVIGFLLRVWATFLFYREKMKVIDLVPQRRLITSGPFRYSRNPLYLGGNVFIFLGAATVLGSPGAVLITLAHLPLVDIMIRREERQLDSKFGAEYARYKLRVRRWL